MEASQALVLQSLPLHPRKSIQPRHHVRKRLITPRNGPRLLPKMLPGCYPRMPTPTLPPSMPPGRPCRSQSGLAS
jgi:hypothetical protein